MTTAFDHRLTTFRVSLLSCGHLLNIPKIRSVLFQLSYWGILLSYLLTKVVLCSVALPTYTLALVSYQESAVRPIDSQRTSCLIYTARGLLITSHQPSSKEIKSDGIEDGQEGLAMATERRLTTVSALHIPRPPSNRLCPTCIRNGGNVLDTAPLGRSDARDVRHITHPWPLQDFAKRRA